MTNNNHDTARNEVLKDTSAFWNAVREKMLGLGINTKALANAVGIDAQELQVAMDTDRDPEAGAMVAICSQLRLAMDGEAEAKIAQVVSDSANSDDPCALIRALEILRPTNPEFHECLLALASMDAVDFDVMHDFLTYRAKTPVAMAPPSGAKKKRKAPSQPRERA